MKDLNKKIEEEYIKSITLRNLDLDKTSYKRAKDIRKQQDESYKKCVFFTNLRKEMEKKDKNDRL